METVSELIAHITGKHHEYLKLELPRISTLFKQAFEKHAETGGQPCDRIRFLSERFVPLASELEMHLHKEEMILFPAIEAYGRAAANNSPLPPPPFGSIANPITVMERDHSEVLVTLAAMSERTNNYTPPDHAGELGRSIHQKLKELDADLKEHIRLENDVLHPWAKRLEAEIRG
jgi:regulator of cell morphogenesis and NO signaling